MPTHSSKVYQYKDYADPLFLFLLLLLTVYLYYPGLAGSFLLDDFANLARLSEIEDNDFFYYYIFSGFSGPSGRPLSLLTFALQYPAWPDDPAAFKAVNLAIHCANGILVWFISLRLIRPLESDRGRQRLFVFFTTAIWLLHPLQLSTTLYVVQRMTLLSSLFTLAGIWAYLHYRDEVIHRPGPRAYLKFMAPVALCLLLAILAKENGILLLLYIIVIEKTLYAGRGAAGLKNGLLLVLALPLLALLVYLLRDLDGLITSYEFRSFTLPERLLTQPSVLLVYLKNILLPVYGAYGLFHDDFPVSAGLLAPPYTLHAIVALLLLFLASLRFRRSAPVFSFAALWFLAGHALEASFVNLELYFEHRNYLPSLGILFGVNYLLLKFIKTRQYRLSAGLVGLIYYMLVMGTFYMELTLWSEPRLQALEWARNKPASERALIHLARAYGDSREYEKVIDIYNQIEQLKPDNIYPAVVKLHIASCAGIRPVPPELWDAAFSRATAARTDGLTIVSSLDGFVVDIINDNCQPGQHEPLEKLILTLIKNDNYRFVRDYLYEFLATLQLYNGQYDRALDYINSALAVNSKPSNYIYKINLLRNIGRDDEAAKVKQAFRESIKGRPRDYLAYAKMLEAL